MSYSEACREALITANNREVVFDTIELHHPLFIDDNGQPMAVRLLIGHDNIVAKLESSAWLNPGEMVTFYGADFEITWPEVAEGAMPQITLRSQNIDRELVKHIEQAAQGYDPITMFARPYMLSNLGKGPEVDPPYMFEMANVTVDVFVVSGTATLEDVHNFPFPNKTYRPEIFKGLVR